MLVVLKIFVNNKGDNVHDVIYIHVKDLSPVY